MLWLEFDSISPINFNGTLTGRPGRPQVRLLVKHPEFWQEKPPKALFRI